MQLADDEAQVLATVGVKELGALGYEYASRKSFGVAVLPVPLTLDQATAQMRVHEQNVTVGLLERKKLRDADIEEAEKLVESSKNSDDSESEEEDVDKKDPNQTKWVRTTTQEHLFQKRTIFNITATIFCNYRTHRTTWTDVLFLWTRHKSNGSKL